MNMNNMYAWLYICITQAGDQHPSINAKPQTRGPSAAAAPRPSLRPRNTAPPPPTAPAPKAPPADATLASVYATLSSIHVPSLSLDFSHIAAAHAHAESLAEHEKENRGPTASSSMSPSSAAAKGGLGASTAADFYSERMVQEPATAAAVGDVQAGGEGAPPLALIPPLPPPGSKDMYVCVCLFDICTYIKHNSFALT